MADHPLLDGSKITVVFPAPPGAEDTMNPLMGTDRTVRPTRVALVADPSADRTRWQLSIIQVLGPKVGPRGLTKADYSVVFMIAIDETAKDAEGLPDWLREVAVEWEARVNGVNGGAAAEPLGDAATLRKAIEAIEALPQDYECDPGRGDSVKLLRRFLAEAERDAIPAGPLGSVASLREAVRYLRWVAQEEIPHTAPEKLREGVLLAALKLDGRADEIERQAPAQASRRVGMDREQRDDLARRLREAMGMLNGVHEELTAVLCAHCGHRISKVPADKVRSTGEHWWHPDSGAGACPDGSGSIATPPQAG